MSEGEKSLKETMQEIAAEIKELKEEKKVKTWNIPFFKRNLSKKKRRQGWLVFVHATTGQQGTFIKAPVIEGVAVLNGVPHRVKPENIIWIKKNVGMVIQPEWSEEPISWIEHYKDTQATGKGSEGWAFIMNYILKSQITNKKNLPVGAIVIGIIIVLGLGYYLMKSGAFH